jgi:putative aldouronate transport system substrate-binding protein
MKKGMRIGLVCVLLLCLVAAQTTAGAQKEVASQRVTLKILTDMNPDDDMNTDPLTALVEEITGYDLVFEKLPDDPQQRAQKVNLILASGMEYDLIRLSSIEVAKELIPMDYFQPLDKLLEKHGPNLLANTSQKWFDPLVWNGQTYGIPIKRTAQASIIGSMYRKDLFNKHGLSVPTTTDEFTKVMKVLKEKAGVIPYVAPSAFPVIDTIGSAFGICNNMWYEVDGNLVPRVKMPGFVPYLEYVHSLISSGLMDAEFAANTDQMAQTKVASGKAASAFWAWWWWPANNAIRQNPGAEIGYMEPLKAANGSGIAWLWGTTPEWATVIPRASKKAADAVKFLDLLTENSNFQEIFLGTEGIHYEKDQHGTLMALPTYTEEKSNSWIMLMVTNDNYQLAYQQIGQSGEDPNQDVLNTYLGLKYAADSVAVADPTGTLPPPEENGTYANSLGALERDFILAVVSGARPISDYPAFISQWEQEGGIELVKQWNNVYKASK